MLEQCYHQNVLYEAVKSQDFRKKNKQMDY